MFVSVRIKFEIRKDKYYRVIMLEPLKWICDNN